MQTLCIYSNVLHCMQARTIPLVLGWGARSSKTGKIVLKLFYGLQFDPNYKCYAIYKNFKVSNLWARSEKWKNKQTKEKRVVFFISLELPFVQTIRYSFRLTSGKDDERASKIIIRLLVHNVFNVGDSATQCGQY